jgi:predicted PurR-regulated permease PerM
VSVPPAQPDQPGLRAILRVVVTVVVSVLALYLMYLVREPISYILLGAFVAIAASGPVNLLSRKLPRGAAIAIVYLGIIFVPIGIGLILVPPVVEQAVRLANNLPE